MTKYDLELSNLNCFCKRIINDKNRPDIKGTDCICSGIDENGVERTIKIKGFVVINES